MMQSSKEIELYSVHILLKEHIQVTASAISARVEIIPIS